MAPQRYVHMILMTAICALISACGEDEGNSRLGEETSSGGTPPPLLLDGAPTPAEASSLLLGS